MASDSQKSPAIRLEHAKNDQFSKLLLLHSLISDLTGGRLFK